MCSMHFETTLLYVFILYSVSARQTPVFRVVHLNLLNYYAMFIYYLNSKQKPDIL